MRILALALLLATTAFAHSSAQSTEAAIGTRLMGRQLYLRGFWSGNKLHFDSAGHLEGSSAPESFTLSGFDLQKFHLTGNKLVLEGRRVGIEFPNGQATRVPLQTGKLFHHKDVPIHIEIAASPGGDYVPALDAIFSDGLASLEPSLPEAWKSLAARNFVVDPANTSKSLTAYRMDKSITLPKLLHQKYPEFSNAARSLRYSGDGLYSIHIETDGAISNISILRPLGLGLDENAIDAIQHYAFRPATKDGKPVSVELKIEVNFRIF